MVTGTMERSRTRMSPRFLGSLALPAQRRGEAGAAWREGFWFSGSSSSTMSSFHQAGISSGTEREAPAVPGKVTSEADVLPGSSSDTTRQRDFQMCLGSRIQSPIPLAHGATGFILPLPKAASLWDRDPQPRAPAVQPGHGFEKRTQGSSSSRSAPSSLRTRT